MCEAGYLMFIGGGHNCKKMNCNWSLTSVDSSSEGPTDNESKIAKREKGRKAPAPDFFPCNS